MIALVLAAGQAPGVSISEPDTLLFGRIVNRSGNAEQAVSEGEEALCGHHAINLGVGRGVSVLELVRAFEEIKIGTDGMIGDSDSLSEL